MPTCPRAVSITPFSFDPNLQLLADIGRWLFDVGCSVFSFDPNLQLLDGLPHSSQKHGRIASKNSGRTGVVALWSR